MAVNPYASEVAGLQQDIAALQTSLASWARRRDDFMAHQAQFAPGSPQYVADALVIRECQDAVDRITGELRVKQDQLQVAIEQRDKVNNLAAGLIASGVDEATAYANAQQQVQNSDSVARVVKYAGITVLIVVAIIGLIYWYKKTHK